MFYGIADCFLLDNAVKKSNTIINGLFLISYESNSLDEFENKILTIDADTIAILKRSYNLAERSETLSNYIKANISNRYLIGYEKMGDSHIKILSKEVFNSENLGKYLLLC